MGGLRLCPPTQVVPSGAAPSMVVGRWIVSTSPVLIFALLTNTGMVTVNIGTLRLLPEEAFGVAFALFKTTAGVGKETVACCSSMFASSGSSMCKTVQ